MTDRLEPPMPTRVRVGCFDYDVEDWDARLAGASNRYGECDRQNNTIRVRTDIPRQRIAETLLHEVLHAVWEGGGCATGDEEKVVNIMGMMLCQVWRDNPDLVVFLTAMLSDQQAKEAI